MGNIKRDEQKWRIIRIYARQNLGEVLQGVESWIKENERGLNTIMGDDFNARTGKMGAGMELDGGRRGKGGEEEEKKVER